MKNKGFNLILLVVIILLMFTGCQNAAPANDVTEGKKVEITTVKQETKPLILEYLGLVEAKEQKTIAFVNGGTLSTIKKSEGDDVRAGELLAALDQELIQSDQQMALQQYNKAQNAVLEAKEQLIFAEDHYQKNKALYTQGAIAKVKLDEAQLKYDSAQLRFNQAQNSLAAAKSQLKKTGTSVNNHQVYSTINGTVVAIMADVGEKIPPMQPVMRVASHAKAIETGVIREDVQKIAIGDEATVIYEDKHYSGHITKIAKHADPQTKTYPVTITLDRTTEELIHQSIVNVHFNIGETQGIWIPLEAIVVDIENFVFINKNNEAVKVKVNLLSTDGEVVKVDGLTSGSELIIKGMSSLRDGDTIEIIN